MGWCRLDFDVCGSVWACGWLVQHVNDSWSSIKSVDCLGKSEVTFVSQKCIICGVASWWLIGYHLFLLFQTATGIARSVSPGQGLRGGVYSPTASSEVRSVTPVSSWSSPAQPSATLEQPGAQVGSLLPDCMDTSWFNLWSCAFLWSCEVLFQLKMNIVCFTSHCNTLPFSSDWKLSSYPFRFAVCNNVIAFLHIVCRSVTVYAHIPYTSQLTSTIRGILVHTKSAVRFTLVCPSP